MSSYILNLMPPKTMYELLDIYHLSAMRHLTNISNAFYTSEGNEVLGVWSAPRDARIGDWCFLRCASSCRKSFDEALDACRKAGLSCMENETFIELVASEKLLMSKLAGRIFAFAPADGNAFIRGERIWCPLGAGSLANGEEGVELSVIPPNGKKLNNFGGITQLNFEEKENLLGLCLGASRS